MSEKLVINDWGFYGRFTYREILELKEYIQKLYTKDDKTPQTMVLTSGMNAISTAITVLCAKSQQDPINLVYSHELYCETVPCIEYISQGFPLLKLWKIDICDSKSIINLFETELLGQQTILFSESCSNPNGIIFPYDVIQTLKQLSSQLTVIIDNTWLSPVIFNPFELGADIVVDSLTKYSGGGVAIGGSITSHNTDFIAYTFNHCKRNGIHVSPHNAGLIYNGIQTIHDRIKRSSSLTIIALQDFINNPNILEVCHPSLENHPSHENALNYFATTTDEEGVIRHLWPSVFSFTFRGRRKQIEKNLKKIKMDKMTSFGSIKTRIKPNIKVISKEDNIYQLRIAIGYGEDVDELKCKINDLLSTLFENLNPTL